MQLVAVVLCADAAPAPQKAAEPQKPAAEPIQKRKAVLVDERTAAEIFVDMLVPSAPELLRQVLVEDTIRRNRLHVKARVARVARSGGSVHVAAVPADGRWSADGEYEANTPRHAYEPGYSNKRRSYILQPDADRDDLPTAYDDSLDDQYYEGGPDHNDRYYTHEEKTAYDDAPKTVPTSPVRGQAKLVALADVEYRGGRADTGKTDATKAGRVKASSHTCLSGITYTPAADSYQSSTPAVGRLKALCPLHPPSGDTVTAALAYMLFIYTQVVVHDSGQRY